MTRILKQKKVKSKKFRLCGFCGRVIGEGDEYQYSVAIVMGVFSRYGLCLDCAEGEKGERP